jgi:hypothetical protein
MATEPITIPVDSEAAKAYREASPDFQRKLQLLVSVWIQEAAHMDDARMFSLMDEVGARAEAKGLTPEILQSILDDE